jgi:probable HAF family extracellular repeat protein
MSDRFGKLRLLAASLTLLTASGAHAASVLIDSGGAPEHSSVATAINTQGLAVGLTRADDNWSNPTGLYLTAQGWTPLVSTGGEVSQINGVNDAGVMVGSLGMSYDTMRAASWTTDNGIVSGPTYLSTNPGVASDINASGLIVGSTWSGNLNDASIVPMTWSSTGGQALGLKQAEGFTSGRPFAVNAQGDAAGELITYWQLYAPAVWKQGQPGTLTSPAVSGLRTSTDINDQGTVVGNVYSGPYVTSAIRWMDGQAQVLPGLGGPGNLAYAINNAGWVVGSSTLKGETFGHAVMWRDGQIIDLNQYLSAEQYGQGWRLTSARGINEAGSVVGEAMNITDPMLANKQRAFMLNAAIPEPQTSALFALGLLGVVFCAHRRADKAS